jgi:polyphosphate kinase 2 (PPK2 family)
MLDFLKRGGFKVTYYKELVTSGFYKTINHLPLYDRNLAIIEEIIKQLQNIVINQEIKAKHNEEKDVNLRDFDDNGDIVIFDRGIYDRLVWFRRLLDNQEITREQYDFVIEKYKEFLSLINCFISLTASPEIALKRDYVSSLALERRGFLSIENIESYNKALQGLVDDGIISGCYTINTDNKELMPATIEVAQHILSKISKQNNITIIK